VLAKDILATSDIISLHQGAAEGCSESIELMLMKTPQDFSAMSSLHNFSVSMDSSMNRLME
jgi:hypothetical protein